MNRPNQNDFLDKPVPQIPPPNRAFAANMSTDRSPRTEVRDLGRSCSAHRVNPAL